MSDVPGRMVTKYAIKPGAIPPDGKTKFAYDSSDYETKEVFVPYTEQELETIENFNNPNMELINRLKAIESAQEDIILSVADMLGGDKE